MKIKGFFKDWLGIARIMSGREKSIKKASAEKSKEPMINQVAKRLHPGEIDVTLTGIYDSSLNSKTFRFESDKNLIPYFEAGQYMTISLNIGSSAVTRPYSISSNPLSALGDHRFVEITIKETKDGFVSDYMLKDAKPGDKFKANIGLGQFYYEPLRDSKNIVCVAGGSGITPFMSMASFINSKDYDVHMTLLYGVNKASDIIDKEKLDSLNSDKVKIVYILKDEIIEGAEKGFITRDIIKKYMGEDPTFFICGPRAMYAFIKEELDALDIPLRRRRFEVFGENKNIESDASYPLKERQVFNIRVNQGTYKITIQANSNESILVALERAGIKVKNACRSGECGFCRIELLEGNVYIPKESDYRRYYDKEYNVLHSCSSYPLSDLSIRIPIE